MNNNKSETPEWVGIVIAWAIAIGIIFLAYAAQGNDPNAAAGPCNYQDPSGLGC